MVATERTLKFLICYASQKGTAQSIAEDITDQCSLHGLGSSCNLSCINDIDINKLKDFSCTIFIGSTTGDGDPPETAQKFMRELRGKAIEERDLSWLNYTILGLGDTNYTNFCNFGKTLNEKLESKKAKRFYECGWADDGTGLEIVVEPWIEGLFPAIKSFLKSWRESNKVLLIEKEIEHKFESEKSLKKVGVMDTVNDKDDRSSSEGKSLKSLKTLLSFYPDLNLPKEDELSNHPVKNCQFSSDKCLTIPALQSSFLKVGFEEENLEVNHVKTIENESISYPMASSEVIECQIISCKKLTADDAVKKTLEISLQAVCNDMEFKYEPGDSFSIIVPNRSDEVNMLLNLLEVNDKADLKMNIKVDPNTSKKSPSVPKFIPRNSSLRYIFTYCLDIRNVPKKSFLRVLIEYTKDPEEKRRISEFASKEGSEIYNKVVRQQGLTFLDFLLLFPSCTPPVSTILENLPRLQPRPYSITSSPLLSPKVLSFVFNVIEIPKGGSVTFERQGLCSGWLNNLTIRLQDSNNPGLPTLEKDLEKLSIETNGIKETILIYFRSTKNFRLPKEQDTPVIMIGPGTGVAPFIGYLKHRETQLKHTDNKYPIMYLFFGCRHKNRDFLFRTELEYFKQTGILKELYVTFSRDENEGKPKYVQDNLRLKGKEIIDCIQNQGGSIYVCGDAKNMSRNVFDTFVSLLEEHLQLSDIESRKYLAQMQLNSRYLQDVWA